MASSTQMSASEWLAVREAVASKLHIAGSKQQKETRLRIAENLMSSGFLDFDYIISQTVFGPVDEPPQVTSEGELA